MNEGKQNVVLKGKYIDFKREEYEIMKSRIDAVNSAMTEKCLFLSLKTLEKNFSFDFVFCGMENYLSKIELYDKKQRKDDLKKWWMNQKASEMAKECLPTILDRMDSISATIAKQERDELSRNKFEKWIKFELLQCALKCSFRRPRSSSANVFPNTSFQYARSRLRKKLESEYFTESELQQFGLNNAQRRKKKDEWIRIIEVKKKKFKEEYHTHKKNKKKHHRHRHRHTHKKQAISVLSSSASSSSSMTESLCSSTGHSSDMPIMEAMDASIPPPPPLNIAANKTNNAMPPALDMLEMPQISTKKPSGYCSQCTSYAMQISQLCKELHKFKVSLGETQMKLNNKIQEVNHWKKKYVEHEQPTNDDEEGIDYKQKYTELQSQIALLIGGNQNQNNSKSSIVNRARQNSQNSMSFVSDPFSVNPGSDKMSISNASSANNRYPSFLNMNGAESVVSHAHFIPPVHSMQQITAEHLKHNTDSTEKMLEKLKHNQNKTNSDSFLTNPEVENVLFPIEPNKNNLQHNQNNNDMESTSTLNTIDSKVQNQSQSTFASLTNNQRNHLYHAQQEMNRNRNRNMPRHNSNPLPDYNHIHQMTLSRNHSSNNNTNKIPTMIPFENQYPLNQQQHNNNNNAADINMMQNNHYFNNNGNNNHYYVNNMQPFPNNNAPFVNNVNQYNVNSNETINI